MSNIIMPGGELFAGEAEHDRQILEQLANPNADYEAYQQGINDEVLNMVEPTIKQPQTEEESKALDFNYPEEYYYPDAEWEYKPVGLNLLVLEDEMEKVTKSGIILTTLRDSAENKMRFGTIYAVGDGGYTFGGAFRTIPYKAGDVIKFKQGHAYPQIKRGNKIYLELFVDDVVGLFVKRGNKPTEINRYVDNPSQFKYQPTSTEDNGLGLS